jgi:thiol-disulfide isomerase/thioredoxin
MLLRGVAAWAFVVLLAGLVGPIAAPRRALGQIQAARPWIGIEIEKGTRGVAVKGVREETPGAQAGLRAGDEVLAIDGQAVATPQDLINAVAAKGVGTQVVLKVLRVDTTIEVTLKLAPRPDEAELLRRHLVGKAAPDFALATAIGPRPARLADLRGQVVVVEFWATWCGPCKSTLPTLSAWEKKYGSKGLVVLGLTSEDEATMRGFVAKNKLDHTVAVDEGGKVAGAYGVPAIPTLVIIDQKGEVVFAEVGAGDNLAAAEMTFARLLADKAKKAPVTKPKS